MEVKAIGSATRHIAESVSIVSFLFLEVDARTYLEEGAGWWETDRRRRFVFPGVSIASSLEPSKILTASPPGSDWSPAVSSFPCAFPRRSLGQLRVSSLFSFDTWVAVCPTEPRI